MCLWMSLFQLAFSQDWNEQNRLKKQLSASQPDTSRLNILLQMAEFETFKPGEYKKDLDSAAAYIYQAEQLNNTLQSPESTAYIIIERSYLAKDREDRKNGQALMQRAFQLVSGTHNWYLLGTASLGLAEYYDYTNPKEVPLKIKYIQQAADYYHKGKLIEREAYCDKCLAELLPDNDLCFKKTIEAIALYKLINYKKLQGVYDLLAQLYLDKNDLKRALEYGLEALRVAGEQHDTSGTLVEIQNDLSTIYDRIKDYDNEFNTYIWHFITQN